MNFDKGLYPEYLTEKQFCEICGVCRSSATKILKTGSILCEKCIEGRLHFYKIPITEALRYKHEKEQCSKLPAQIAKQIHTFYEGVLSKYSDALSISDISKITGYGKESIRKWIINNSLSAVKVREVFWVSHEDFLRFVTGERYNNITRKSIKHLASLAIIKQHTTGIPNE